MSDGHTASPNASRVLDLDRDLLRVRRDNALFRALISGAALRLMGPLLGALTIAVATRGLGDVRFGVVATLVTVTSLLGFADLGVGQGLLTRLAAADGRDDPEEMRSLVSSAWVTMLGAGAVVTAGGLVAELVLPWQDMLGAGGLPVDEVNKAVTAAVVITGVAVPAMMGQRVLLGLQRGTLVNIWTFAGSLLTPAAVVVAVVLHFPLWFFVVAFAGAPVIVALVQTAWVFGKSHAHLRPRWRMVTLESVRRLVGVSGLFLVLNLCVAAAYQADALIVAGVVGASAAAVFAVTLRMFALLSGLLASGTQQLWPAMAEAFQRGDIDWIRSRFLRVSGITAGILTPLCGLLIVIGQPFVRIWAGPTLVPPMSLLICFAVWTVYGVFMMQVSYLLSAADVVAPQVVMALTMTAANLALSLYLTHRIGISGPILGSLLAHIVFNGVPALMIARALLTGRRPLPRDPGGRASPA